MKSAGQAMVEFAVAVTVLVLLLLGMPIIGRYHELQVATIEGARQMAFKESWRSGSGSRADTGAIRVALFPPPAGDGQPEAGEMAAQLDVRDAPGNAGRAARALLAPFLWMRTSGFDLRDHALHSAELNVAVTNLGTMPQPFSDLPVTLSSRYVLLGDGWDSSGPAQVSGRAGGLLITDAVPVLRPLLSLGKNLLAIVEPAFRDFCPGIVDPEQVPADRLGPQATPDARPSREWAPQC
jgi:hypothetical protein